MKPKISVVVPIYNVEKYLNKCIDSLINQDYDNLELILINDKSNDNSLNIAMEYEKKYNNIKVISNKENKGLSYTRNLGIDKSTGDYISFIDSDDFIPSNYFSSLLDTILKNDADVSVCDINIITDDKILRKKCGDNKDSLFFINNGLAASACNKLFKKSILKYKFEENKINEDLAFTIPILASNKISYNEDVCYNYFQRDSSIQNKKISFKRFDIFDAVNLTLSRIDKSYEDVLVFNQLILFLLYVIPKEKNIFYRYKLLRKFYKLSKNYDYINNKYFKEFILQNGKIGSLFYKYLVYFTKKGLCLISNIMIFIYHLYTKIKNRNIVHNITKEQLVKKATKQSKIKSDINVSVVVPNYNYSSYLYQRIYSILNQNYKIYELIILDDNSIDNSKEIIEEIKELVSPYINLKIIYNMCNSGTAFKQWQKGFNIATGEYIWIAEADDYCNKSFLKTVIKPIINNKDIVISYCDTKFIDSKGSIIMNTIKNEIDIQKTGHYNNNFMIEGKQEFKNYTYLNCTIANVSSTIIKKGDYSSIFKEAIKYKQAGDWIFYANVMQNGYIAYNKKGLNYYRVHDKNVSTITKKESHLAEIKSIHEYYRKKYGLTKKQEENIKLRYIYLNKVWNLKEDI